MDLRITEDVLPRYLLRAVVAHWPSQTWPGWFRYDTPSQRKTASRVNSFSEPFAAAFHGMAQAAGYVDGFPDFDFHGAGLFEMRTGDFVGEHRDARRHPLRQWLRVASSVLYLDGGDVTIKGETIAMPVNAMAMFDPSLPHEVPPVPKLRRTLNLFWWREATCEEWTGHANAAFSSR